MRTITLLIAVTFLTVVANGQEIEKDLEHFTRIVASPRVNVILNKGDRESIRLQYHDVSKRNINIHVTGRTLRIYLDNARKIEPTRPKDEYSGGRESIYQGASVTAYITYRELARLEIRGNQELTCNGPIEAEQFTLCAYGENDITLASLKADYFKAKIYGENRLRIKKGRTVEQKYLLYGENKIDTKGLRSDYIFTRIFGEGSLKINSSEEVLIDAFGEPKIYVDGGAQINRRVVIGKASVVSGEL